MSKQHSTLSKRRHFTINSFAIVAETGNIITKNVNNIVAKFGYVERIVRLVAFDNVVFFTVAGVDGA